METIWVECGQGDCRESGQVGFDTDAGNARFKVPEGWVCLPMLKMENGAVVPNHQEYWFVCPEHRLSAEQTVEHARLTETLNAVRRALSSGV